MARYKIFWTARLPDWNTIHQHGKKLFVSRTIRGRGKLLARTIGQGGRRMAATILVWRILQWLRKELFPLLATVNR
jgi:hypothetical protein